MWWTLTIRIRCGSKLTNPETYTKLIHRSIRKILHDKITGKYKLVQDNLIDQINKDFTNKLNIRNK